MRSATPAARRYLRRFFPVMLAYCGALFFSTWAIRAWEPQGATLVALAVLPALPILGVLLVIGLYIHEEADEYLRRRAVSGMMVGLGTMLSFFTVWGFLEDAGVVGHIPAYWTFVVWCVGWGVAEIAQSLRDRRELAGGGR
ncbi:hypothetical protein ACFQ1E_10340 [Sphingomonas canadensis]|uniref:Uncharacterized protein n=1 Tax=Sphingomonas canadensis TaxID=1219257 RepID=A0ABW3H5G0_9SPHN|nr:hypothetical protein [Sphingomonas canadensis]MCW3836483.1 hypothetical protein [Sphingomonas canadensis]